MSQHDPNRLDPNRPELRDAHDQEGGFNWNWVIGGLAAIVVLFVALSFLGRDDEQTAQSPSATTTGQSTPGAASPRQSKSPNVAPTTPTTPNMSPSNTDRQNAPAAPNQ